MSETAWPEVPLGEVATIERSAVGPEAIEIGTTYVGLEHITSEGTFNGQQRVEAGELASQKYHFTSEHVLYGKLRPYLSKIACPTFKGVCSTDILPIRPQDGLDRRFLLHFLRQPSEVAKAASLATGANLPRLSPKVLATLRIPRPPLEEQRRIAAILDAADQLRAKRRESLVLLDSLTESIFVDMFGDPVTNSRGFAVTRLESLGALDRGVSKHRPRNAPELLGGPYPLIQTGDVANCRGYITEYSSTYSELGLQQSKIWPAGTLCITIAANIAKTGLLTFDACFPDSVVGFTSLTPGMTQYVRVLLGFHQQRLERLAPEFAQKNINLKVLRELEVPSPAADSIASFSDAMADVQGEGDRMATSVASFDALFASLQHRAFRGEL